MGKKNTVILSDVAYSITTQNIRHDNKVRGNATRSRSRFAILFYWVYARTYGFFLVSFFFFFDGGK